MANSGEVIYVDFSKDGLSIDDRRALALHEWIASHPYGVSKEKINAEFERLNTIIPGSPPSGGLIE